MNFRLAVQPASETHGLKRKEREKEKSTNCTQMVNHESKRRRLDYHQIQGLEAYFQKQNYPSNQEKEEISKELNIKLNTVNKWFVNRRVRMRNENEEAKHNYNSPSLSPSYSSSSSLAHPPNFIEEEFNPIVGLPEGSSILQSSHSLKSNQKKEKIIASFLNEDVLPSVASPNSFPTPSTLANVMKTKSHKKKSKHSETKSMESGDSKIQQEPKKKKMKISKEEKRFWKHFKKQHNVIDTMDSEEGKEPSHSSETHHHNLEKKYLYSHRSGPKIQQEILKHIIQLRKNQNLPPFFVMITGPTIHPYRMEELSITLGRNTSSFVGSDVHLSDNKRISRVHVKIEFDYESGSFHLINLSRNGLKIRKGEKWIEVNLVSKLYFFFLNYSDDFSAKK